MSTLQETLSKLQLLRTELSIVKIKFREFSGGKMSGVELALRDIDRAEGMLSLEAFTYAAAVETQRAVEADRANYCKIMDEYQQPL